MRFGWDTVATFSQNEEGYSLAVNDLVTELERANITCAATISFAETDFKEQLKLLRVYNLGMYGAEYAWILQDTYISSWWLSDPSESASFCSSKALLTAVENLIIVSSYNSIVGMGTALSGL
uniref:Receptor ligand binding region domain-containing protein n=1 Tax=Anopheles maculatus TaxID=74869 RepID=A0A182T2I5_9DIPT